MAAARVPADETARLRSLHGLDVLGTPPDPELDALVQAAALACGAPVSLVSLLAAGRERFEAGVAVGDLTSSCAQALCAHALLADGLPEVPDLQQDARFAANPHVTAGGFRFYAAAPLRLSDGTTVGTLCVLDHVPRQLDAGQRKVLALLATATGKALESRLTLRRLNEAVEALRQSERMFRVLSETSPLDVFRDDAHLRLAAPTDATPAGIWELNVLTGESRVDALIDITARKQQEETLQQSERFLKRTSQVAGVGGWEFECATNTLFLSDAACLMVDCEPGHRPTNEQLRNAYPPETRRALGQLDRRARTEGLGWDVEIEIVSFKGRRLWLRSIAEVESANGVPVRIVGSTQDITALVEQRRAVEQAKERLALATESGGIGIWELDVPRRTLHLDALSCRAYGIDATEATLALDDWLARMHPEDSPVAMAAAREALRGGPAFDVGARVLRPDGSLHHVRVTARVTRDDAGRPSRMTGACWDVTQLHRLGAELAEQHELLRVTLQSIGDAVITTDAAGHVTWLNPIAERMTGWPAAEAKGRPLAQVFCIVHEETRERAEDPVDLCLERGAATGLAHLTLLVARDGTEYGIEDSAAPICNDRGDVLGAVLVFHDVTQTRRLANEMSHRAMHDALTGLVNRAEFEARLARLLTKAQSDHSQHALLYIDLDQFKLVNDTCGHSVGDQLLQQVAKLLTESVRSRDTVARLGGDEFGVILEHCPAEQAERIAQQICDRMNEARFVHDAKRFRIGTSIGLVPLDSRWDAVAGLMQAADTSCYAAKEAGRNRVHVWFDTDLTMRARHSETRWATRVEQALDEHRFVLFAQRIEPIGGSAPGLHAEVLLRLVDADGSLVAPGAFLPAAERFHLASRLDRWVMHHAIDALVDLPDLSRIEMLSINLSGKSIGDRAFHRHALELLAGAGEAICRRLCLEITETAAVTHLADAALFIEQVRALGVRIALDDFGAGASSFGYLKTLKVDVLKIDGQFIKDVLVDALDDAAVRCFVDVARVMGMQTVAEFVDSPAVLARLGTIGVDYAQGYLLHRPEPLGNVIGAVPARAAGPTRSDAATAALI